MAPFSPLPVGWTPKTSTVRALRPSELSRPFPHAFGQTLPSHPPPPVLESKRWMLGLAISCFLMITWFASHPDQPSNSHLAVFDEGLMDVDPDTPWALYDTPKPIVGYGRKVLQQRLESDITSSSFSASTSISTEIALSRNDILPQSTSSSSTSSSSPVSASSSSTLVVIEAREGQPTPAPSSTTSTSAVRASTTFTAPPQAVEPSAQKYDDDNDDQEDQKPESAKKDRRRSRNRSRSRLSPQSA